ncbi:uncharacterized protein [Penaeus vannamei]|uniref:uncharacterized protein n=1 Tax=Penaeus vannamei TaxID=6689 RepID=UPI00387F72B0
MERSAEPLQSLSANARRRNASGGGGGAALKKKKKRRRRRRRTPKEEEGRVALVSPTAGCGEPFTPARGPPTPVLRPVGAQVPRAPENSTQFIMDDHENSALFLNFDKSTPGWEHDPPASGGEDDLGSATPTHAHARDWYPFNLADFESAYRSAREDRLMRGSRTGDLCAAIVALEARAAVLTEALSASPSRLVATLQAQLLTLQEENAALRQRLARRRRQVVPRESSSSSTDSDSESDSTNSSSDCSESDCDTCAARRSRSEREEEKENTRPAVISPPTTP